MVEKKEFCSNRSCLRINIEYKKFCENFNVSKKLPILLNLTTFIDLKSVTQIILPKNKIKPNNIKIMLFKI